MNWDSGADLKSRYRALSETIGLNVSVVLPNGARLDGLAIGVDDEGRLILESGDLISVGDIIHLR